MKLLEGLRRAIEFLEGETAEAWATDEDTFEDHFQIPYEEFGERLSLLDLKNSQIYQRTLEANPEAAVLWVLFVTE